MHTLRIALTLLCLVGTAQADCWQLAASRYHVDPLLLYAIAKVESNLNPKLMKDLVLALLELARNGQQVILATHDYVLLKWFDLLLDKKGKGDQVRFHVLSREAETGQVLLDTMDDYRAIEPNAIAETFNELTKEQVARKMGGLGK